MVRDKEGAERCCSMLTSPVWLASRTTHSSTGAHGWPVMVWSGVGSNRERLMAPKPQNTATEVQHG